jgi:predicted nucleotidyltransferase
MARLGRLDYREDTLAAVCRRCAVRELSAFGSMVRGDFRPDSDVDVLVDFEPDRSIDLFDLAELRDALTELFGRPVDLVPKRGLKPFVREAVLSEARVLHAA